MNIYFDNSATTMPYDEVVEEVSKGMKEYFGNPSSLHKIGMNCEKRLNEAREYFASTIKCNKDEIYFTSGGSEGNNLVLKGLLKPGHHLITTTFEHHSIINTCKELEDKGVKITYLDVDSEGRINITINNLSIDEAYDIEGIIVDRPVKSVTATILTNKMDAHNTFDNPEVVKPEEFKDFVLTSQGLDFKIPACSVISFVIE